MDADMTNLAARFFRPSIRIFLIAVLAAVFLPATGRTQSADRAGIADLAPRKMVYALTFLPSGKADGVKSGKGTMTVELTGSRCTEYRVIRTLDTAINFANGGIRLVSESVINEKGDGTQLAFSITDHVNGEVKRQDTLIARQTPQGIVATSRQLPGGRLQLPKDVVMPLRFERMMDEAMAAGRPSFFIRVFNPEDSLTSIDQISFVAGKKVEAALPQKHPAAIAAQAALPRHQVEMVRKDKNGKFRVRDRQTRFSNGVFTVSDTDFENMKIKASLASLRLLPRERCR